MAEDNNGDVDRAVAAFAAPRMRYFTFAPTTAANAARVSRDETPSGHRISSEQTGAFPLLIAALPDINQAAMPAPPAKPVQPKVPAKPQMSVLAAKKTELQTRRPNPLARPVPHQRGVDRRTTPIASMFNILNAASASHHEPTEAESGLKEIFSRL